ncbi:hypothetical protein AA20_11535 [Aliarcobacter butzleri L348]|uniref:Uncharacterized protein n=1 Tax=Aliarcobacter butzleri L348 TaxID=1447256 RepID=A0A0G9JR47_9BACT|nr:hypothetical protein AA20_11535 [Aliarcobacter butzleri L348]
MSLDLAFLSHSNLKHPSNGATNYIQNILSCLQKPFTN